MPSIFHLGRSIIRFKGIIRWAKYSPKKEAWKPNCSYRRSTKAYLWCSQVPTGNIMRNLFSESFIENSGNDMRYEWPCWCHVMRVKKYDVIWSEEISAHKGERIKTCLFSPCLVKESAFKFLASQTKDDIRESDEADKIQQDSGAIRDGEDVKPKVLIQITTEQTNLTNILGFSKSCFIYEIKFCTFGWCLIY